MRDRGFSRRSVVVGLAASAVAGRPVASAVRQSAGPAIVPRATWGPDLLPTGPAPDEPDVRFLLVHHTVDRNDYAPDEVVGLLAAIYRFHTSPEKGWPDIAYNFLIDRFGTIYEGRTGSLEGPKAGDATGGSQGFAQLCCFIGDHSLAPPSEAAVASMAGLLAFLGDRHGLDLSPGATTSFVSRGSNRWPAGTEVTASTISGHRDMSTTACPGDFAYVLVEDGTFARLATGAIPATTTTSPPPPPPPPTTTSTAPPPTTTAPLLTTTSTTSAAAPSPTVVGEDGGAGVLLPAAVAAAAAAVAGLLALRTRRRRR